MFLMDHKFKNQLNGGLFSLYIKCGYQLGGVWNESF